MLVLQYLLECLPFLHHELWDTCEDHQQCGSLEVIRVSAGTDQNLRVPRTRHHKDVLATLHQWEAALLSRAQLHGKCKQYVAVCDMMLWKQPVAAGVTYTAWHTGW
jgi:hypothetical protein